MRHSNRNLLIILIFIFHSESIFASHSYAHGVSNSSHVSKKQKTHKELIKYNKSILKAFSKYKKKVEIIWGDEAVVPDNKTNVTYRNNMQQRSVVDFENGTVDVELALKSHHSENDAAENNLASAVKQALLQGPDERSIIEIAKDLTPPESDKPPVLIGLVADENGEPLNLSTIDQFNGGDPANIQRRSITGKDGKKRTVISTSFRLIANHIKVRAEKFQEAVNRNSIRHKIPAPMIYAIMEIESSFNPTAKSPVPAFGLMQLVPRTGARDAYKYLFSKDKIVKDTYLYDPNNNIELGVAYLHVIYFRYLRSIKDPISRQWATIAAYNTGVRNVFKSFSGKYSKANFSSRLSWKVNALKRLNEMNPDQVYEYLLQYLPSRETRMYIEKVRDRMGKYSA